MDGLWTPNDLARWVRRRRKARIARATGESVGMDPDFYDHLGGWDEESSGIGCFVFAVIIAVIVIGGGLYLLADGGGDGDTETAVDVVEEVDDPVEVPEVGEVEEVDESEAVDEEVDSESDDQDSDVDTSDSSDTSDSTAESDEPAMDGPDPRAQVTGANGLIDANGQLWLDILFKELWGSEPVRDLFSFFFDLFVTYNPTVEVGWQTHDGIETILGITPEAYILDDGTVLIATDLFPTRPFVVTIEASYGSWVDEAGLPAVFGQESISIDSESIEDGDPLVDFGAEPIFDLVAGS